MPFKGTDGFKKWLRGIKKHKRKPIDRFMEKFTEEPNTGCWLWTGFVMSHGYAQFAHGNTRKKNPLMLAHRFSYIHFAGPIPRGKEINHKCRVRSCVNPDHLEVVTHRENMLHGFTVSGNGARLTHCKYGHEFTPDNLAPWALKKGWRRCLACQLRESRAAYAKAHPEARKCA